MPPAEPLAAVPSPTDAALITAWQGGDEQAAAELVRRHARALARFLAGAGAPEPDLDDVVQETFIRAFRAVGTFRGQCRFRTWLLTIGGNVLKDAHRRAKRTRVVPLADDLRSTDGDPHERAVAAESERRLGDGLGRLTRMQREVFLLRAQQGLEYDEIAAALGTARCRARALPPRGQEIKGVPDMKDTTPRSTTPSCKSWRSGSGLVRPSGWTWSVRPRPS